MTRLTEAEREERKERKRVKWREWQAANREYDKQRRKDRYAADPERDKAATRKAIYRRKYGLTIAEYEAMVVAQGGRCAICGTDKPGGVGRWPIDHCSESGVVRGLLCNGCNPGIGFFKHDINRLQQAIDYLKRFL